ncbi:copper chaperone PCu(A)C [Streptomyces sp. GbtcB6]|uniref:copper chaperone PCu(A)C n=1 Tax=Streptomyces sp. GbtcB6 TaxID=2824751 RepID=UPI001C308923|nr:copper chaperone PCu(A)C [Streptomyces sp. GbtcB6]
MTTAGGLWRPTRRRLDDTLLAALAPVAMCIIALAGLSMWTVHGNAGSPARITVAEGRVYLPSAGVAETAAFFRITNSGGSADRLVKVASAEVDGAITLSRHRMTDNRSAYARAVGSVAVAAGESLAMSPDGLDAIVPAKATWQPGDLVPFTLYFEHSGAVRTLAVVVSPGESG